MKLPPLTGRDRRAILLGLVVLGPVLFFFAGVRPYLTALADARDQLSVQRELLERELELLMEAREYPELMERLESSIQLEVPRMFGGSDGVTAAASLASYVGEQARRSRVHLQESESRDPEASEEGLLVLRVGIRGLGDLTGILTFLHGLEQGAKVVRIDDLTIEPIRRSGFVDAEGEEALAFSASVSGYALVPQPAEIESATGFAEGER